jgi:hypothetical protein
VTIDKKASLDELEHAGVKGMRWHVKKPASQNPSVVVVKQAAHIIRRDAGFVASRAVLKRYGPHVLPATKTVAKSSIGLLKYSGRVAKGSGMALRLLGTTAKVTGGVAKSYVKGAVKLATMVK